MNHKTFQSFWTSNYPESYPIGYELKSIYKERWFRIHSLPDSKRYATSGLEYQIILNRQNRLITDILGEEEETIFLLGLYSNNINHENHSKETEFGKFKKVDTLALHKIKPEEYEEEYYYDIFIKQTYWKFNQQNEILRAIADDEIRMMFIGLSNNRIVYPYDGGVDLILESTKTRNFFKKKYSKWLSNHSEGL